MNRKLPVDLLRGFIMIIMAIDHASTFILRQHFMEPWGVQFGNYPSLIAWFTRFITHLCAPGFFFLMGMSMVFHYENKKAHGWRLSQSVFYFAKRGAVLMLCMFFLEAPGWLIGMLGASPGTTIVSDFPGLNTGGNHFIMSVLFVLGCCMALGGCLLSLQKKWLVLVGILSFVISITITSNADPTVGQHPLFLFFFLSGIAPGIKVLYPIFPWLGLATFGMAWAKLLLEKPDKIYRYSLALGTFLLFTFVALRLMEFGNYQYDNYRDLISFFTLIKYPPSLVFALFTCGLNLVLFYLFSKVKENAVIRILKLFGQTALFFYITHIYVYGILGYAFPDGSGYFVLYLVWFIGLIPLYFLCKWYLKFKRSKDGNSIWRML